MKIPFILFLLLLQPCSLILAQGKSPSHSLFNKLLAKYVSRDGRVNYKGFTKDSLEFDQYLKILSSNPPNEKTWTREEQMAYWINAYNAFTIELITRYYPLKSIKDIGSSIQIPFVNTPWDMKFIVIGKEKMDLNNIEHGILRKKFSDPRIHMVLVCASKSCPVLLNEAYDPRRLDEQLKKQTTVFLEDPKRNKVAADQAQLSMIFKWYAMDFNKNGSSVHNFINTYTTRKITPETKISYLDYDWNLNE
jgi:Protein of unknown function, DUF547